MAGLGLPTLGKRVHPHGLRHSYAVSLERADLTAIEALERADLPELAA